MADVTQTFTPMSGTSGRVKKHVSSPVVIAGVSMWKRRSKATIFQIPHFESPADGTTGLVQPKKLRGIGDNLVDLEGIVNTNATDQTETGTTALTNGAAVALDLLVDRDGLKGYSNVTGWVSDFQLGTKINNEAATFTCTIEVDGVFPAYGSVT